jgi:hypothetical protein
MRITALSLLLLLLSGACSDDPKQEQRRQMLRVPRTEARPPASKVGDELYDKNGLLLPSEQTVAGLALPRGLNQRGRFNDRWIFDTRVPLNKLHWYFGARLTGGSIKRLGRTTTYTAATPMKMGDNPGGSHGLVRVDVRIGPSPASDTVNLVDIRQLPVRMARPRDQSALDAVREQSAQQRRFPD